MYNLVQKINLRKNMKRYAVAFTGHQIVERQLYRKNCKKSL